MAYPWVLLILLENILLRGKEGNSLLVHAHHTLAFSLHFFNLSVLLYSLFSFLFLCCLFSSLFFISFLSCYISHLFFLTLSNCLPSFCCCLHYVQLRPFYTACRDKFYCFTPQLLLAWCGCPSQTTHWFVGCPAITTILCWPCHIPFLLRTVFSAHVALLHWQPMLHQYIIDFLGKSI